MRISARFMAVLIAGTMWLGTPTASRADFIINGGFETGDFTGWTLGGDTSDPTTFGVDTSFPQSGTYAAYFGAFGDQVSIMQTITTVPGLHYQLDFYLMNESGGSPNEFTVTWGSQVLDDESSLPTFTYKEFTYDVQATATTTIVSFAFRNDFSFFDLDTVSVRLVPEPASLVALGIGAAICVVGARIRRRSK